MVSHSYNCEEEIPDFYAHIRWDQDRILEAIAGAWNVYELQTFRERLVSTMRGRSVFYTRDGLVGVAGCEARPGDEVVAIVDGLRPFSFRRSNRRTTGCYEVVSDAYVHGFDICGRSLGAPRPMLLF